jgi:hypothetical protein
MRHRGTGIGMQADEGARSPTSLITAEVEPAAADQLVEWLTKLGASAEDYVLSRIEVVAPVTPPSSLRAEHRQRRPRCREASGS